MNSNALGSRFSSRSDRSASTSAHVDASSAARASWRRRVPAAAAAALMAFSFSTMAPTSAAAEESDAAYADATTCAGSYEIASSMYGQISWVPSARQRFLAAVGAQKFWTQAAALCPAVVFPEATAKSALAAKTARDLAGEVGMADMLPSYVDDLSPLLAAVREACGYQSDLEFHADGSDASASSSSSPSSSTASQSSSGSCSANSRDVTGLTASEFGGLAVAEDRVTYVATALFARTQNAAWQQFASQHRMQSSNFAAMAKAMNGTDPRAGVYDSQAVRTLGDTTTDPITGVELPTTEVLTFDAAVEELSAFGTQSDDNTATGADGTLTLTGSDLSQSIGDANTDPAAGFDTPWARRRAVSEYIANTLLNAFENGEPADEQYLLG
ncbi:MAG: hypothetical protein Q4G29_02000 [Pseudoscardovia radai]|nr:hypothetical protein [Pseudoscardovia radai]